MEKFYTLPKDLCNRGELRKKLSITEVFVFEEVVKLCREFPENRKEFTVDITTRQLSQRLQIHQVNISRILKKLEELGYIKYKFRSNTKGINSILQLCDWRKKSDSCTLSVLNQLDSQALSDYLKLDSL
jgi:DNA-binding MarR family transcriptional regulator